jgi:hypothetical protein
MRIRALAAAFVVAGAVGAVPAVALAAAPATTTATTPLNTATLPTPTTTLPATTTTATTTTTTATTTTTTTTTVAPTPAKATPKLYLSGLFTVAKDAVTVPGRDVKVTGVVAPYVAGQRVLLQAFVGKHMFTQKLITLAPSKKRVYGGFTVTLRAPSAGTVAVRLKHTRSTGQVSYVTEKHYTVLSESAGVGSGGTFVQLVQQRLGALHIYIPQTGVYDQGTELALDAYHRLLGWGEGNTSINAETVNDLLNGTGSFHVRFPGQGVHAEGDLSIQDIAYMNGSKVEYILPISSGKPSTPTVLGSWEVYRKQPEYTSDGMYFSNFFTGGYAIHGYDPAPDYPASHGCMRLPMVDAIFAYNLLEIGDWVDTYYT